MKKLFLRMVAFSFFATFLFSCSSVHQSMRTPNNHVEFYKSDFEFSGQVTGEATTIRIIGIDWSRLFHSETGSIERNTATDPISSIIANINSIPVIGNIVGDKTSLHALREMMRNNPGYDVVFYPQYEATVSRPILGLGFIMTETTVKATARLAKIK